jgi:hypothetical protein
MAVFCPLNGSQGMIDHSESDVNLARVRGAVAIALVYGLNRFMNTLPFLGARTDVAVRILCIVLFVGSGDALLNYYAGTGRLLGRNAAKGSTGDPMTNGRDHDHAASAAVSSTNVKAESENKPTTINLVPSGPKLPRRDVDLPRSQGRPVN